MSRHVTALWRVALRARGDEAEPARARLLELAPRGIEEQSLPNDVVELAVYVGDRDRDRLLARLPDARVAPVEDGWEESWRAFHRPVVVGGLWIGPPWESVPDPARAVVIDPGQAFGTGAHPTTRLCVELLAETPVRGSLLDVGSGSGVLAIAGVRLGFAPVRAIDSDPVAVTTTEANAAANAVPLEVAVVDALVAELPTADVAVANVLLAPVELLLTRLEAAYAVVSGYLATDELELGAWVRRERRELDGWAADLLEWRPYGGIVTRSV